MQQKRIGVLVLSVAVLIILGSLGQAQNDTSRRVAFVRDNALRTASPNDIGADGTSRLVELFRGLGADIVTLDLSENIPTDIDVLVYVGASRALSIAQIARIGTYLFAGGNLLLASDAPGYDGVNVDRSRQDLDNFLTSVYGLGLQDGLLVESWASTGSIQTTRDALYSTQAEDVVVTPLLDDLLLYDLPVEIWGGRPIIVDAFGPNTQAFPLLYAGSGYAETDLQDVIRNFRTNLNPRPITYNIGDDPAGHLLVAGYGINTDISSRAVLLGDSEIALNLFGLGRIPGTTLPRHPGNFILLQRLAAWLLEIPESEWPGLPEGLTFIALDGMPSDWAATQRTTASIADEALDVSVPGYDLIRGQFFYNNHFVYGLLQTLGTPAQDAILELESSEGAVLRLEADGVFLQSGAEAQAIRDADLAISTALEIRIPLRILEAIPQFTRVCIRNIGGQVEDCLQAPINPANTQEFEAVPVRFSPKGPLARTTTTGQVNLRQGPTTQAFIADVLDNNVLFGALGRNAAADWVFVANGNSSGWIAASLLSTNIDPANLPIVTGETVDAATSEFPGTTTVPTESTPDVATSVPQTNVVQAAVSLGQDVVALLDQSQPDAQADETQTPTPVTPAPTTSPTQAVVPATVSVEDPPPLFIQETSTATLTPLPATSVPTATPTPMQTDLPTNTPTAMFTATPTSTADPNATNPPAPDAAATLGNRVLTETAP